MFTGIIEETGKVQSITKDKIVIECSKVLENTKLGDSIAVNGVCLTVVELLTKGFTADISPETSKITILHKLKNGDIVNLERAMKADGRFGGHIVSGHVDGLGKIINYEKKDNFFELNIDLPTNLAIYIIKKGSITINGISLTIAEIKNNTIKIAIIPHTYENTNLSFLKNGDFVNIEVDILAKYVEKFLSTSDNKSRISLEYLQEHGF
jgi:riboflavin synthase